MGIKSAAKKVGKAIIFMKLFEDIKNNKEPIEADIAKLKEIIEEWKAEAPEDKSRSSRRQDSYFSFHFGKGSRGQC